MYVEQGPKLRLAKCERHITFCQYIFHSFTDMEKLVYHLLILNDSVLVLKITHFYTVFILILIQVLVILHFYFYLIFLKYALYNSFLFQLF